MVEDWVTNITTDRIRCDVCGRMSMFTCTQCGGDFCDKHRVHYEGHGDGYGPKAVKTLL